MVKIENFIETGIIPNPNDFLGVLSEIGGFDLSDLIELLKTGAEIAQEKGLFDRTKLQIDNAKINMKAVKARVWLRWVKATTGLYVIRGGKHPKSNEHAKADDITDAIFSSDMIETLLDLQQQEKIVPTDRKVGDVMRTWYGNTREQRILETINIVSIANDRRLVIGASELTRQLIIMVPTNESQTQVKGSKQIHIILGRIGEPVIAQPPK